MDAILWLQSFSSPALDRFFVAVTALGSREFYMILIPVVYWCVDRRVGIRLGLAFLTSIYLNFFLKDLLRLPRPAGPGLRLPAPGDAAGYGFPSGHAQGNATVWGYLAASFPRPALVAAAAAVVALVALSRLYLGVHYPADVAGGIVLGLAVVILFRRGEALLARRRWSRSALAAAALAVPLAAVAAYHTPDSFRMAGMAVGLSWGHLLQEARLAFGERAAPGRQAAKVLLGLAGLYLLRVATGPLAPEGPAQVARYALLGFWIAYLAPLAYVSLGLAGSGRRRRGAR